MDNRMRGIIEKSIDFMLKHDVVPDVEFMRGLIPLKSYEDTVLGYQLGVLKNQIYFMLMISSGLRVVPVEDKNQVDEILKRRVLEIREKSSGNSASKCSEKKCVIDYDARSNKKRK